MKISENLENRENHKIYPNFPGTAELTLLKHFNSQIAPWFSFSLNFIGKLQMDETVKNERNTLNKKTPEIINRSTFFGPPTSCTLQPYWQRAVNREPGYRSGNSKGRSPFRFHFPGNLKFSKKYHFSTFLKSLDPIEL